ncbi:ABC transporter permease [Faecalicatena contorta]|uniref:ABC transporter permease n=1 Tax=Faecalicatena contorta TaxID=39482 RepID=UPI001FAECD1A|nr:ABC transporter permease [Faecalicatena contorta]
MEKKTGLLKTITSKNEIGTLFPLVIMCIVITAINPAFIAFDNIMDVFRTASYYLIVGAPLTLLLLTADMDLSIGAVTALGGVVCVFAMKAGLPMVVAILLGLAAGAAVGIFKAYVIVELELPALIVTLGIQYAVNGIVSVTTQGMSVSGATDAFKIFGQGRIFGNIHLTVIFALLIAIIFQIVISRTKYGRSVFAIGGNPETSRLAGIPVKKRRIGIHVMVSVFAALTGIFMASRFNSAQTTAGQGTELTVMAAVIIGGTSMFGGSGSVTGSVLGCILLAVISNGLVLVRVPSFWQNLIFGIILLISVGIDKYRQKLNSAA